MYIDKTLVNFLVIGLLGLAIMRFALARHFFKVLLKAIVLFSIFWILSCAFGYLFVPAFLEQAEGNIAAVSAFWNHGGALYTELDSSARYSLLYGPWPYLVSAAMQGFSKDFAVSLSKFSGVVNLLLVMGSAYWLGYQAKFTRFNKVLGVGLICVCLLGHVNYSYWNRPDSYLMAYAFLAFVFALEIKNSGRWAFLVPTGLLMGLAVNCKVHGFIYFIPVFGLLLDSKGLLAWPRRYLGFSIGLFLGGLAFPFFLSGVDFENYLTWLSLSSKHGLSLREFIKNCTYISVFLVVAWALGLHKKFPMFALSLLVASFGICVVGSKIGAGIHHFIPLLPMILWMCFSVFLNSREDAKTWLAPVIGAFVLSLSLNAFDDQKRLVTFFGQAPERFAEFAELKEIAAKYPGPIEVGVSDGYNSSFSKAWMTAQRGNLWIESAGMTDMALTRNALNEKSYTYLKSCQTPRFVFIKQGAIWKFTNSYNGSEVFPPEFKEAFLAQYTLEEEGQYFRTYVCNDGVTAR